MEGRCLRALIPRIGEDTLDEGEEAAVRRSNTECAVAILHSSRVDDDVQEPAERVDQDMLFATL